jgi:RNase P subunit RPR2
MVFRSSPHVKRLVCKGCFGSLIPGISCDVRFSTQGKESERADVGAGDVSKDRKEIEIVADAAVDRVDGAKRKVDRSEKLIIYECRACGARRKYPVKGYKKLFHDTTTSTVKEIE